MRQVSLFPFSQEQSEVQGSYIAQGHTILDDRAGVPSGAVWLQNVCSCHYAMQPFASKVLKLGDNKGHAKKKKNSH